MKILRHSDQIWAIEDFWSEEFCNESIAMVNELNSLPLNPEDLDSDCELISHNSRIYYDNEELAEIIWDELKDFVPVELNGKKSFGINKTFRFYRYIPGQEFKKHFDTAHTTELGKSKMSLLIYLNNDFTGGNTIFENIEVSPKKGTALIFPHELLHSGGMVESGMKYILRGNIMFTI